MTHAEVDFTVTVAEEKFIRKIAARARRMNLLAPGADPLDLDMDLCATIAQGVPLRLKELLAADDFNFSHDVCGIQRHMNRETGALMDHFVPRFTDSAKMRDAREAQS